MEVNSSRVLPREDGLRESRGEERRGEMEEEVYSFNGKVGLSE